MKKQIALAALLTAVGACSATAFAQDKEVFDGRFYIAPMASGIFADDKGQASLNPDADAGMHLSFGKPLNKYLSLELFGNYYPDIDLHNTVTGSMENIEYGLTGLLFPLPDKLPVFILGGGGFGNYDFTLTGVPGLNGNQDGEFWDVGVGFLLPLKALGIPDPYGFSIRGEYRFRHSIVSDAPGNLRFNSNIVQLGLQIPLGPNPNKPAPKPVAPTPVPVVPVAPLDSDGDGVPDSRDQCPGTQPGTEVDDTGCPLAKAAPIVLRGVTFEYNSAKLTAQAHDRLDNVVNALQGADSVSVEVDGHTDSRGSAAYNLKLSQQRADSVKSYLVTHGVAADRLTTRGFGETRPVAPNTKPNGEDNPAGRAQNRRVELHVVDDE